MTQSPHPAIRSNLSLILAFLLVICECLALALVTTSHAEAPQTALEQRTAAISRALKARELIVLDAKLTNDQRRAQRLAIAHPKARELVNEANLKVPLLAEVFGVYPLRESDLTEQLAACRGKPCFRVEIYSFAANHTTNFFVSLAENRVLGVHRITLTQPDIPEHLTQLALELATQSPLVSQTLGFSPAAGEALMANTKTALNRTRCERSRQLCVAPTFIQGERALWTIVNLTELAVVGVRWTTVGQVAGRALTEVRLANANITDTLCDKSLTLARDGWVLDYMLTSSDGLKIANVRYRDRLVLHNAKLVDWHVSYSTADGFGYSDAVGCPYFSQAAVIAAKLPSIEPIIEAGKTIGFALIQDFWSDGWPTPCNYYYRQRYEFYSDGRFRPAVASVGRGCGDNGTYRPVTRLHFAGDTNQLAEWTGASFTPWKTERWQLQQPSTAYAANGAQYRLQNPAGEGFAVIANQGQMNDGGRNDNAYLYATKYIKERDEGESDLVTLGPCCNTNHEQGPEKFIGDKPDNIESARLVLWYVPQLKNDSRAGKEFCWANSTIEQGLLKVREFPCYSGPLFVPLAAPPAVPPTAPPTAPLTAQPSAKAAP